MSDVLLAADALKATVGFEAKRGKPESYDYDTVSVYVPLDVTGLDQRDLEIALQEGINSAKVAAFEALGRDFTMDKGEVVENYVAPAPVVKATKSQYPPKATPTRTEPQNTPDNVVRGAFPGTVTVKKQKGALPDWFDDVVTGVDEVWDNRNDDGTAPINNRPWFSQVMPQGSGERGRGFYPPK